MSASAPNLSAKPVKKVLSPDERAANEIRNAETRKEQARITAMIASQCKLSAALAAVENASGIRAAAGPVIEIATAIFNEPDFPLSAWTPELLAIAITLFSSQVGRYDDAAGKVLTHRLTPAMFTQLELQGKLLKSQREVVVGDNHVFAAVRLAMEPHLRHMFTPLQQEIKSGLQLNSVEKRAYFNTAPKVNTGAAAQNGDEDGSAPPAPKRAGQKKARTVSEMEDGEVAPVKRTATAAAPSAPRAKASAAPRAAKPAAQKQQKQRQEEIVSATPDGAPIFDE